MALMTAKEYIDSLRKLNTRVYMFGEKIDNWVDHPMIRPSINCVAMTYALAQDPQYAELMTVKSSLTGHTINRFTHLHQSTEDLMNKVKKFAKENDLIVRVEELKSRLALDREKFKEKPSFLLSLHDTASIKRAFENNPESFSITKKIKLKAEQLTENVKEKSAVISENLKEKSEVITEGIKAAGTEAKARIGETLNRNDSSDVADTDLFDNSHRDITEHKNEK